MADLYSRLQELKKRRQTESAPGGRESAAPLGDGTRGGGDQDPARPVQAATDRSPGLDWARIAPGVYERSRVYPVTEGAFPFEVDQEGRWYGVSPLVGSFSGMRPIFLDVETSGLSGGAGSTAFLIGLGFLTYTEQDDPAFSPSRARQDVAISVSQLFLSEPAAESALLARYAELVGDPASACYVTYNGASFDLPVLRTRHIMNRGRLPEAVHWDLLPMTRRLYAPVIGSCTLGRVEQHVLGLGRDDDVPGSEVPARYHRFVDSGEREEIAPVLAHHYYDVAHLALLAATLQEILSNQTVTMSRVGHDRIALAKFLLQRGTAQLPRCADVLDEVIAETEQRRRYLSETARAGGFTARVARSVPQAWSASRELQAVVARRMKHWDKLRSMRRILWEVRGFRYDAIELAKVLEHRFRDYSGALAVIERWHEMSGGEDHETTHRANRLRRKIARKELLGSRNHSTERR